MKKAYNIFIIKTSLKCSAGIIPIPDRLCKRMMTNADPMSLMETNKRTKNHTLFYNRVWRFISKLLTFGYGSSCFLRVFGGMKEREKQQAWREKTSLCIIIFISCLALGFITFGMSIFVCRPPPFIYTYDKVIQQISDFSTRWFMIHGIIYNIPDKYSPYPHPNATTDPYKIFADQDISVYFPNAPTCLAIGYGYNFTCSKPSHPDLVHCHDPSLIGRMDKVGTLYWNWEDITPQNNVLVYNGLVLKVDYYLEQIPENSNVTPFGTEIDSIFRKYLGGDATLPLAQVNPQLMTCLIERFGAGLMDSLSFGCLASNVVLYLSLVAILALILVKFVLAIIFISFYSKKLAKEQNTPEDETDQIYAILDLEKGETHPSFVWRYDASKPNEPHNKKDSTYKLLYTIVLITCYSEGEEGLRSTIESLVETDYPDDGKLLFIVADGLITGVGNDKTTPEILIDMMEVDPKAGLIHGYYPWSCPDKVYNNSNSNSKTQPSLNRKWMSTSLQETVAEPGLPGWLPEPYPYDAIGGHGNGVLNTARVFAGHYCSKGRRTPAIVVVKCGSPEEMTLPKPGNRGKRDSQMILMAFLSKIIIKDKLNSLEYDIYTKMQYLMKDKNVNPEDYEAMLCVDADTVVLPDCLTHLANALKNDRRIIGLCGETRIANRSENWITAMQVFEYFISHYLNKAFESIFGGVTCLPGCFCMYRIKTLNPATGTWTPLLASMEIVNTYRENVTDTLHKKNLLLLGEDRYLTTLMLKNFPERKCVFLPRAACLTEVPNNFKTLLSQRRRWINSTIHNLFELVTVNALCGTFCCSMQFVIFMELIGTLVLPAAILFTLVLIVSTFVTTAQIIPLALLFAILGLPGILTLFTTRDWRDMFYLIVYLLSLPIWNFVLPVYAYWHFDDFSWGQTRKVDEAPNTLLPLHNNAL